MGNFDRVISIMCKGFRALARRVIGALREEGAGAVAAIAKVTWAQTGTRWRSRSLPCPVRGLAELYSA